MQFSHRLFLLPVIAISALIFFRDFFSPGLPTGFDLGTHYYLALEKYALLSETGFWDGLLPQWYLGFSPFAYYPDLFYFAFAAAKFLLSPVVGDVDIFKLLLIAVFYFPILGAYHFSYVFHRSRVFALIAASLVASISLFSGGGFFGYFEIGLVNQTLGMGLYLFCLSFFIQWYKTGDWRFSALSLCCLLLIIQAHVITLAVTMLSLGFLISWGVFYRGKLEGFAFTRQQLINIGLMWFIPVLISLGGLAFRVIRYWGEHGSRSGWGDVSLLRDVYDGMIFSAGWVNIAAVLLIAAGLFLRKFRALGLPLLGLCMLLMFLGGGYVEFGGVFDIFNSVFRHRAWGFAGTLAMLLAVSALFYLWEASAVQGSRKQALRAALIAVVAFMLFGAIGKTYDQSKSVHVASTTLAPEAESYLRIADRIRRETPPESVLVYQLYGDQPHDAPFLYLASSLAVYTNRVLLQGHQIESSRLNFDDEISSLNQAVPGRACEIFETTGATHFLAWSDPALSRIRKNPCFTNVMTEGHFHLFAYRRLNFSRLVGDIEVSSFSQSRHRYIWVVKSEGEGHPVRLGFSYHPRFRAEINGKPARIERGEGNFMMLFGVPRGESIIILEYKLPAAEIVIGFIEKIIAAAAFLFLCFYGFYWRYRMPAPPRE